MRGETGEPVNGRREKESCIRGEEPAGTEYSSGRMAYVGTRPKLSNAQLGVVNVTMCAGSSEL